MQDRMPGAPGQYKAILTADELKKMQAGEQFTITMIRDDRPIVKGTPYSKAAVLPDELAKNLCPDIQDPTPADAFAALLPKPNLMIISGSLPNVRNALWFDLSRGTAASGMSLLSLDEDEAGYAVMAAVEGETYGVGNATVNQGAASGGYDFTVL